MQKVLIVVPYSHPSKCGIWNRAWSDAKFLKSQGFDVTIFSSNVIKGTKMRSGCFENFEGINIRRFKVQFSFGGTSMFWFFPRWFIKLSPHIVHVHGYRHPHSLQALILSKLFNKKVFITTHAPFEKDNSRSWLLKLIDALYDIFIGWWELRLYKKVIRISKWEEKYLIKLGVKSSIYIPNGISPIFTDSKNPVSAKPLNKAIFMGRIDPIKRLEWIKYAATKLPQINFLIRGPLDGYDTFDSDTSNLIINPEKYEHLDFKNELAKADLYILPSVREALPFTLLEAMSQGVIALSSASKGGIEVIEDGVNGFIFNSKDELVSKIEYIYANWNITKQIRDNAEKTSLDYKLDKINALLQDLYSL